MASFETSTLTLRTEAIVEGGGDDVAGPPASPERKS